jgi:hypothetical protein
MMQPPAPMMMMMQAPVMQQFVDRTSPQGGATSLQQPSVIRIAYNAQVGQASCGKQFQYFLTCRCYNHSRSYLYLRENSIETSEGADHMCSSLVQCLLEIVACPIQCAYDYANCTLCCCIASGCSVVSLARKLIPCLAQNNDNVSVVYFDRDYFEPTTEGCCCVQENTPKLEIVDHGCMVCCIRCPPLMNLLCGGPTKDVVIMPFESRTCCWCCDVPNRVGCCHNCCGLCGRVTGSPLVYDSFYPQPKNVEAFVTVAQPLVASRQGAGATLPLSAFALQRPAAQAFVHAAPVQAPLQYVYPPAPNAQPPAMTNDDQHRRDVELKTAWHPDRVTSAPSAAPTLNVPEPSAGDEASDTEPQEGSVLEQRRKNASGVDLEGMTWKRFGQ